MGVGGDMRGATAGRWDGATWLTDKAPGPTRNIFSPLRGVACPSPSRCLAFGTFAFGAGRQQFLNNWDGARWVSQPVPRTRAVAHSISCIADDDCWIVGERVVDSLSGAAFTEHWDGRRWRSVAVPNSRPSLMKNAPGTNGLTILVPYILTSVSCVATDMCMAVGRSMNGDFSGQTVVRWNGSKWMPYNVRLPKVNGGLLGLFAVSCSARDFCMAVGGDAYLISYKWDGRRWSRVKAGLPMRKGRIEGRGPSLNRVVCFSNEDCLAAGTAADERTRLYERWDGRRWRVTKPARGSVTARCPRTGSCLLVR